MVSMGGRVSEEVVYGTDTRSNGAASDFQKATGIAQAMVKAWGMSELGPISFVNEDGDRDYSPSTATSIDQQIAKILKECFDQAKSILEQERSRLDSLAKALLERETLDAQEVYELLALPPKVSHSFVKNEEVSA